ncbi:MAG: FAD-binding oxidoreductase [Nocardioidaceae bacterium]
MTATDQARQSLVIEAGCDAWDEARVAWNLAVDQQPAAVMPAASTADVVDAFALAHARGWRVAAQGTGHNPAPLGSLTDTLLVKTAPMREVSVDPDLRRARTGGGALWGDVATAAGAHGLAPLAGSSADVGVVGYTLGGGLSWLGRLHGLASNSVTAIEVVTPDGVVRHADNTSEPDLFWALRGGGGSFGVVTALEFTLYPLPTVYAGQLMWPLEQAADVLLAWRRWAETLDRTTSTCVRLLRLPPLPEIPEPLRGGEFVSVEVAHADVTNGAAVVAPMRGLAPLMDLVHEAPATALMGLHMDPDHPVPGAGAGALLTGLPDAAVDSLLTTCGPGSDCSVLSVEIRRLGGALAEPPAGAGAIGGLDAAYLCFAVGMAPPPAIPGVVTQVEQAVAATGPWHATTNYLNFVERPTDPGRLWPAPVLARLREVSDRYDPAGMMHSNHPLR